MESIQMVKGKLLEENLKVMELFSSTTPDINTFNNCCDNCLAYFQYVESINPSELTQDDKQEVVAFLKNLKSTILLLISVRNIIVNTPGFEYPKQVEEENKTELVQSEFDGEDTYGDLESAIDMIDKKIDNIQKGPVLGYRANNRRNIGRTA